MAAPTAAPSISASQMKVLRSRSSFVDVQRLGVGIRRKVVGLQSSPAMFLRNRIGLLRSESDGSDTMAPMRPSLPWWPAFLVLGAAAPHHVLRWASISARQNSKRSAIDSLRLPGGRGRCRPPQRTSAGSTARSRHGRTGAETRTRLARGATIRVACTEVSGSSFGRVCDSAPTRPPYLRAS